MLIQANALTKAMIDNDWLFPAAECVHIASFALAIGTIALVDLSLLGVGLRRNAAAQIARNTALWTLTGLVLIIFTGFLLFASDPDMYLRNASFRFKITCLVLAIVYHYTIHRKVALSQNGSGMGTKLVAGVSLALWVSVVFSGLFIAFV
jgi:uncharacterized protein DUF6644